MCFTSEKYFSLSMQLSVREKFSMLYGYYFLHVRDAPFILTIGEESVDLKNRGTSEFIMTSRRCGDKSVG